MGCLKFDNERPKNFSHKFYIYKNTDNNAKFDHSDLEYFTLYFITKGYVSCVSNGDTVRMGCGDFCIAPPDVKCTIQLNSTDAEYFVIYFSISLAEHILQHQAGTGGTISKAFNSGKIVSFKNTPNETRLHFEHLIELLYFEFLTRSPNAEFTVRNCLAAMFCFFPELIKKQSLCVDETVSDYGIFKCIEHIKENFSKPLSLNDMVRLSKKQKSDFCLEFKKVSGYTFKDYLNKVRIEKARNYLKDQNKNLTIYKVAELCGYDNYPTFYRNFIKYTGTTPIEYSKN